VLFNHIFQAYFVKYIVVGRRDELGVRRLERGRRVG
jgi:hypothetical protein